MHYDYEGFSELAGSFEDLPAGKPYRVRYRRVMNRRDQWRIIPLLLVTLALSSLFFLWLIQPSHYPKTQYLGTIVRVGDGLMFWAIVVTEGLRLLNSFNVCWSAWFMRDPVPVRPQRGLRVAFATTIVPSKEPLEVVRETLEAALRIRHDGILDVWLLDEGDDRRVWRMCSELGVHHFTRKDVPEWNRPDGAFKARSKHGNYNAWLAAYGPSYDVVLSVDPDHVPRPNFAERLLGYFRDPDVAFVVGPQVYGNFDNFITKAAEAQNYMFHGVVQRAANRWSCGMFVGTNHAYRVSAWEQMGGFQDSITEDLATSMVMHGLRNPDTGSRWKSVYTPDVLAVGEGPATWTDYFSQQLRWARGANEVLVTSAAKRMRKLPWTQRLHYSMIMVHYPTVALTWLCGILLTSLYMLLGTTGIQVHVSSWLALYVDVFLARMVIYFALRRFNVSPHEEPGTGGVSGIFAGLLATPFYSSALVGAIFRRKLGFVVTPKGDHASPDRLITFRKHLFWGAISVGTFAAAVVLGHLYPANIIWTGLTTLTCVTPIVMWRVMAAQSRRRAAAAARAVLDRDSASTTTSFPLFGDAATTAAMAAARRDGRRRSNPVLEDVAG